MNIDQLLCLQKALESAENRLLAANKDRPIEPIKNALDQIRDAKKIVDAQMLCAPGQEGIAS